MLLLDAGAPPGGTVTISILAVETVFLQLTRDRPSEDAG